MSRRSGYGSLNEFFRGKYDNTGSRGYYRMRFQQDCALEIIESGTPVSKRSPGSWSVTAHILGRLLKYMVHRNDSSEARKMSGSSADRAARCLLKAMDNCALAVKEYERRGFAIPKAEIKKRIDQCAETYREYRSWKAKGAGELEKR